MLTLDNAYDYAAEMTMHVRGKHGEKQRTFPRRDQIAAEIEYFAQLHPRGVDPEPSGLGRPRRRPHPRRRSSSRRGSVAAVPIEPVRRTKRPDLGQEIRIPGHPEPPLVDVQPESK